MMLGSFIKLIQLVSRLLIKAVKNNLCEWVKPKIYVLTYSKVVER